MENKISIHDNLPFAALTVGQAGQLISGLLSDAIQKLSSKEPTPVKVFDTMNIGEASQFLNESGYFTKRNSIYNLTATNAIPFKKIGRRVVFSRAELTEWVKQKIEESNPRPDAALTLAESANRKK